MRRIDTSRDRRGSCGRLSGVPTVTWRENLPHRTNS
jgi:hypothetical protein